MYIVTGSNGFIAYHLIKKLNSQGINSIIACDEVGKAFMKNNAQLLSIKNFIDRANLFNFIVNNFSNISGVYHLGARTDTTEMNESIFQTLNFEYSQKVWQLCSKYGIPLVYASSAATYGDGTLGFDDEHNTTIQYRPLNPYGWSKHHFDLWALEQKVSPPKWAGLKFFNVYGTHESHKARMASVIFHTYHQIIQYGEMKLFKSHKEEYEHGQQKRDFISVDDIVDICTFCMASDIKSGLYNCGTNEARSYYDLASAVFTAMDREINIRYIDIPADIREKYQYFTEAKMDKLISQGYTKTMTKLEDGVRSYISWLQHI